MLYVLTLVVALLVAQTPAPAVQDPPPAPDTSNFVWDGACKDCHEPIYKAWKNTKHASAWNRLNGTEKQQECANCHITGPRRVENDGRVLNGNVQCEACHGAGRAHVEAAKAGPPPKGSIVRTPTAADCERCHNAKSPKFKGFFYQGMSAFVHRVR